MQLKRLINRSVIWFQTKWLIERSISNTIAFTVIFDFREMPTLKLGNSGGIPGPEQNICFINAVLNLLFSVTAFRQFFQRKLYNRKGQRQRQKLSVCDEVAGIFNCVGATTSAGALRAVMGSLSPKFEYIKNGHQQGAPEFLEDLLETLERELRKRTRSPTNWENYISLVS